MISDWLQNGQNKSSYRDREFIVSISGDLTSANSSKKKLWRMITRFKQFYSFVRHSAKTACACLNGRPPVSREHVVHHRQFGGKVRDV